MDESTEYLSVYHASNLGSPGVGFGHPAGPSSDAAGNTSSDSPNGMYLSAMSGRTTKKGPTQRRSSSASAAAARRFVTSAVLSTTTTTTTTTEHHSDGEDSEGISHGGGYHAGGTDDEHPSSNRRRATEKLSRSQRKASSVPPSSPTSDTEADNNKNARAANQLNLKARLESAKKELNVANSEIDAFMVASKERQDMMNLLQQIIQIVVVIMAYGYSKFLDRHNNIIAVVAVLWFFLFLYSQVRYGLAHLTNELNLVRQDIENQEKKDDNVDALGLTVATATPDSPAEDYRAESSIAESNHLPALDRTDALIRRQALQNLSDAISARNRAATILTQVRLGSYDQVFTVVTNAISLVNLVATYMLISSIRDRLDPNFSDGVWMSYHVVAFVLVVVPIYVEFATSAYQQATYSTES